MSKKNNLDNVFNTESTDSIQVIETYKELPPVVILDAENGKQQKEYVVNTYVDIIEKGKNVLGLAVDRLENSDTTQFDLKDLSTVASLIHALSSATEKLNNSNKTTKKEKPEIVNNTQNNVVMSGTREDIINKIFNNKEEK